METLEEVVPTEASVPAVAGSDGGIQGVTAQPSRRDVWLHVYNTDPITAFANRLCLLNLGCPIHHLAVEVYGTEWCFQYFEDTWNDPDYPGVFRCKPKKMPNYEYQYSLCLGPTALSEDSVQFIIRETVKEWPACSYHLIHRNCITYAEALVDKLRPPQAFPEAFKAILAGVTRRSSLDGVVDYGWECAKWFMVRKHQAPEEREPIGGRVCIALGSVVGTVCGTVLLIKELPALSLKCLLPIFACAGCCLTAAHKASGPRLEKGTD